MRIAAAALAAALALLAAACGGGGKQSAAADSTVASPPTDTGAAAGASAPGGCRTVPAPAPKPDGGRKPPQGDLDASKTYRLVFRTSCGAFTVTLDLRSAPRTAASLVALAKSGFYDGTVFHRIVPGFVIQGGDPTGTGTGGPGYSTVDPPAQDARYTKGVVAMAKTGAEPAGTAGSQFFVVTGEDVGLPPEYAVVGEVTSGLDVVERIGRLGDPATEQPTQPVVVESVAVEQS